MFAAKAISELLSCSTRGTTEVPTEKRAGIYSHSNDMLNLQWVIYNPPIPPRRIVCSVHARSATVSKEETKRNNVRRQGFSDSTGNAHAEGQSFWKESFPGTFSDLLSGPRGLPPGPPTLASLGGVPCSGRGHRLTLLPAPGAHLSRK